MKTITLQEVTYEVLEDENNCLNHDEINNLWTEYFYDYDYIVGDYAYNKLRLKGFCDKSNKRFNKINDYSTKDVYLKEQCAYKCKYFVLKKVKNT